MTSKRQERLRLLAVLTLAAILRMAFPGMSEFKADEARLYTLAYDVVTGESIPLHGIVSSIGIPNFPLSVWLYALPISLWRHPYSPILFTGFLNTLAVFACWWFARRYWGPRTGIISALLFAVSPWAIIFSRKIWAQNLLPIFVLGWAITAIMTFTAGRRRAALIHGVMLGCVPQIHFSGFVLLPISIVTALIYHRRVAWGWLACGVSIAAAAAAPLAFYFGGQHLPSFPAIPISPEVFHINSLAFTWMLSTGSDIHALAGNPAYHDFLQTAPDMNLVHWVWGGLIAFGCSRMFRASLESERLASRFVIAWLGAPALIMMFAPVPVYPHYFIVTFPAQYIAAARGATTLVHKVANPLLRTTAWGTLLASAGLQVWATIALFQLIALRATPGGYGIPLAMKLAAAETARAALHSIPASEVIIVGNGNDPDVHQFPAVYEALLRETPHRFVDGAASAVRTASPAIVLLQTGRAPAEHHYLRWSTKVTSIPLRIGESPLKVLELPPMTSAVIPGLEFSPPHTLANGVRLAGYQPVPSKDGLRWNLYWSVGDAVSKDFHFFNHLLDVAGETLGQSDLPAFPADQWRPGDRVISFFFAPLVAQPATLRVGMYTYPGVENVPVVDGYGNIVGQAVTADWRSE